MRVRAGKYKLGARAKGGGQSQGRGPSKGPGAGKYKHPFILHGNIKSNIILVNAMQFTKRKAIAVQCFQSFYYARRLYHKEVYKSEYKSMILQELHPVKMERLIAIHSK